MIARRIRTSVALGAVAVLAVTSCGGSGGTDGAGATPSTTAQVTTAAADRLMVVIGDSIPYGGHFCPGCTAFPDTYGQTIEQTTGHAIKVQNHSRDDSARLEDIEVQVREDHDLRAELAKANVVLISVGFNNGPPWPAGNPCGGRESDDAASQVATVLRYRPSCIGPTVQTYRAQYDRIYTAIAEVAPKFSTLLAVNVYNNWIGNPGIPSTTSEATLKRLAGVTRQVFDDWNSMLCSSASRNGFTCVDIYHAFNGPNGLSPPDRYVQINDYTHPSQAGNDLIAGLLAKVPVKSP